MNSYEAKQAARKARLEARAERLASEANATHARARQMAGAIPFGQPVLVGHHSERRDRNFRDKIHNTFGKSFDLSKAAEDAARRAESVGSGGVSSDDPDAVLKLRQKLTGLENAAQQMTATNAAWRKAGKPTPADDAGWIKVANLIGRSPNDFLKFRQELARRLALAPYLDGRPFEAWAISNNGAEIRRVKARIGQLEARAVTAEECPVAESEVNGVRVVENAEENRLQLFFPGKPDAETRETLKRYGFRWAPSVGAWQRQLSNGARYAAERILKGSA